MIGPLLAWINVLESHVKLGIDLPVNIKFCFEGIEPNVIKRRPTLTTL